MEKKLEKLDEIDRNLLALLDRNSRLSLEKLSKIIKISRERLGYRIKILKKNKIIRSFHTIINPRKLGYLVFRIYCKMKNSAANNYEKFFTSLSKKEYITWTASLGGDFDSMFEILAKSPSDMLQKMGEILRENAGIIDKYEIVLEVNSQYSNRNYLAKTELPEISVKNFNLEQKPNQLDKKILQVISNNSRLKTIEIARITDSTPITVSKRIKQMEKSGIIKGYSFSMSQDELGISDYRVRIRLTSLTKEEEKRFFDYAREHTNITNISSVIGTWSIELHLQVEDPQQYYKNILEIRTKFSEQIVAIESLLVFNFYKWSYLPDK